jgi:hypothetical protein
MSAIILWPHFLHYNKYEQKGGLTVKIKKNLISYPVFGIYILPNETVNIEIISNNSGIAIHHPNAQRVRDGLWKYVNKSSASLTQLHICDTITNECMQINIFTKVPYKSLKNGKINNYRIGEYPSIPWKGNPKYSRPDGFIELTKASMDVKISPHFTIGQFLCKQESGWPKYLVIREELILKLEYLLQAVNNEGYAASSFHIMSGFRTPFYNKSIGNVKYSRHVFGDAADIFIDENKDGMMDDINGDGLTNEKDIEVLYSIFEKASHRESYEQYIGGLGKYKKTKWHSGFIHVDTRGYRARW